MKSLLFTSLFIGVACTLTAQRSIDLSAEFITPVSNSTAIINSATALQINIRNNSTVNFTEDDTLKVTKFYNGDTIINEPGSLTYTYLTGISIPAGSDYSLNSMMMFTELEYFEFCYNFEPQNHASPIVDPVISNNKTCIYLYVDSVDLTADVKNLTSSQLQVYPNPAVDYVQLSSAPEGDVYITNVEGKRMKNLASNQQSIDVSDLPNGLYFIHFEHNAQQVKQRFVVQH